MTDNSHMIAMDHGQVGQNHSPCSCDAVIFLSVAVIFLSCTSLSFFLLSIYLYRKSSAVPEKFTRNRSLSFAFGERFKINSFTCLQLKSEKQISVPSRRNTRHEVQKDPRMLPKFKYRPGHLSNSASGSFKRFEPKMSKLCSKLSLGRSNTISHSSYNSANEELEFDLYDYGQAHIGEELKQFTTGEQIEADDFSMTEFAPTKLFPSDDTIVNASEVKPSSTLLSMNSSSLITRRSDYGQAVIASITSDLASSIMSDIHLMDNGPNNVNPEQRNKGLTEGWPSEKFNEQMVNERKRENDKVVEELVALQRGDHVETLLGRHHVWNDVHTETEVGKSKLQPPITLIEELELWDDD